MQEEKQKISPIKQRILQFVDTLGISKRDFYAKTGISRGTLESATGITEDTIAKVFAIYPDLSPSWLIIGIGEMLNNLNNGEINCNPNCNPNCNLSQENQNKIDKVGDESGQVKVNSLNKNAHLNAHLSDKNTRLTPQYSDKLTQPPIAAESAVGYIDRIESSPQQYNGANDIIMNLIDRLNTQAEEIGALRQENSSLKRHLAQIVEDAGNVSSVPA